MPPLELPLDDFSLPCSRLVPPPVLVPDLLVVLVPDLVSDLVLVEPRTDVSPRVVVREWIELRSSTPRWPRSISTPPRWPRSTSTLTPPPWQPVP
jgi:hypothetical protein